ncbi:MAG: protein kinase [Gemmataceae bacterium]|nr:protein kinase [Gemmataceae bacterium]
MPATDVSDEDRLVDLLDEALAAFREHRAPATTWDQHPQLAAEGAGLLATLHGLVEAVDDWSGNPPADDNAETVSLPADGGRPPVPDKIGRYRIVGRIGSGGMGEVYRGHDPHLDRAVAVKVPRFDPARPEAAACVERFLREARVAAAIRHANVCPIYDVGVGDGLPFVVMALVEGESLAERLRRAGRFEDVRAAVALVRRVADALVAVHAHGVVHRDLKPANILLDASGTPLLTDFGLARSLQEPDRLTRAGAVLGTPAYMPPEQAQGAAETGPTADLYALGVVLYELVTGRLPFSRGTVPAILRRVIHDRPAPPTDYRPDLDPKLVAIIDRALDKSPDARFADARAFGTVLDGWLTTAEPAAPRPGGCLTRRGVARLACAVGFVSAVMAAGLWACGVPTRSPVASGTPSGLELLPLDGDLFITVSSDSRLGPVTKTELSVDVESALPVRGGELIRMQVRLHRPAHVYLLWVDSRGQVQPCYPWDIVGSADGWRAPLLPGSDVPRKEVRCPDARTKGLAVEGAPGLETAVLLARSSPLPAGVNLAELTGQLPPSPFNDPREVAWLDLGPGRARVHETLGRHRGLTAGDTRTIDTPLFAMLEERLRPHFELIKAVRFAHTER